LGDLLRVSPWEDVAARTLDDSEQAYRRRAMLRTPVCQDLGIEVPIMQAAIWPATAPELVAAVSEVGGLGSIACVFESAESVERQR
jgi:hypothetical protein